jgi:hypothetical protein
VSAGRQCEEHAQQLWQEAKPDEYFFLEMFGSAVVEHLVRVASGRICGWADAHQLAALPHYSPGYTGWDVAEQVKLWELLRSIGPAQLPSNMEVFPTGMLRPKKSLLAVMGLTHDLDRARQLAPLIPCETCALPGCDYRRGPYRRPRPPREDVRFLQGGLRTAPSQPRAVLNPNAKYSINSKALKKWSSERLQLAVGADGSVTARFAFEGTTCSNQGRPLEFHYHVRLAAAQDGYRILEARCEPAPGDTGHTFQCEYLSQGADFLRRIASEQPLLGRPLDDVLTWERSRESSGCFCAADRRAHKWGMVFEVIHFALVERGLAVADGQSVANLE